jgi:predicted LPLAT superfamily acyltransferase
MNPPAPQLAPTPQIAPTPQLEANPQLAAHGHGAVAEWRRSPERGSQAMLRVMAWLSMRLGRRGGRLFLYLIGVYFFLFAPKARRTMRDYLRRALGREPDAADRFRNIMAFATTIHDRVYLLAERFELFDVSVQGGPLMRQLIDRGEGAILMGAHMGSFEMLRWIGEKHAGPGLVMTMYEDNAVKMNAVLAALAPRHPPEIIALGRIDAMLRIRARLEERAMVGMLADRSLADESVLPVSFLGATAYFPTGPMRAAAMLGRRVVFMLGLYRGGNRYHVVFEPLADFSTTPQGQRQAAIEAAITRYAALLEQYCRSDPYNWFNFFDFWRSPAAVEARAVPRPLRPTERPQPQPPRG